MKTRVEFIPGSVVSVSPGKVQIGFCYFEDDLLVKKFSRIYGVDDVKNNKDAEVLTVALLPLAEMKWGTGKPPKEDKTPKIEADFDQVAAVRVEEVAEVVAVKEVPKYEKNPKPLTVEAVPDPEPVEDPVEEGLLVEDVKVIK